MWIIGGDALVLYGVNPGTISEEGGAGSWELGAGREE
jgi:hypothetical protein